ncbi:hypothetical protein AB0K40_18080 [Nonomuraea bangladeshensis]|uniref:Uncharacterized protein n=1 Tax=Nonomuraea bangladeshensis TaxID=404385 RepID=A0ABV3H4G2_9ACTN
MTSIIPEATPHDTAHKPAAAALAQLAALPLPEIFCWEIRHPISSYCRVSGQLMASESFDVTRLHLAQFAAVFQDPQWRITPYKMGPGGKLAVIGRFEGVPVEVWASVEDEHLNVDVTALAELDEPVEATEQHDAPASNQADEFGVHFVTVEPLADSGASIRGLDDDPAVPPRLAIAEYRPGRPIAYHGTEGWIPLADMPARAMAVAERLGAFYIAPTNPIALDLLREVAS